jgi:hypothetical protein
MVYSNLGSQRTGNEGHYLLGYNVVSPVYLMMGGVCSSEISVKSLHGATYQKTVSSWVKDNSNRYSIIIQIVN